MRLVTSIRRIGEDERGAALVVALLFFALTTILISAMLATTGREILIAGLHQEGVKALELAQAGIQEGVARMQNAHVAATPTTFTSSLTDKVQVTISAPLLAGTNGAYRRITAVASSGNAIRRVSVLVLEQMGAGLPKITYGEAFQQPGTPNQIMSGDVYSRSYVQYQSPLPDPNSTTYAAWRISQCQQRTCTNAGTDKGFCYSNYPTPIESGPGACLAGQKWYPGTRMAETQSSVIGSAIKKWGADNCINGVPTPDNLIPKVNGRRADRISADTCSLGCTGTPSPSETEFGFDRDVVAGGSQVSSKFPCGLPFRWIERTVADEQSGPGFPVPYRRLFKTIVFEQWRDNYWVFDEAALTLVKTKALQDNPQFGAIPPFPDYISGTKFDNVVAASQVTPSVLGCHQAPPSSVCASGKDEPVATLINGNWSVTNTRGQGTLVVNGDMTISSSTTFDFWGTIIVMGKLDPNIPGQLIVHGNLIARDLIVVNGSFKVYGTDAYVTAPVGSSTVFPKAWWESSP